MAKEPIENTSEFDIGDYVHGKKFANFEHDFDGIVEKIYENSLLVMITEFDPEDSATVNEYNQRAVVRMSETKILKKTDNPAPRMTLAEDDEEDDEELKSVAASEAANVEKEEDGEETE